MLSNHQEEFLEKIRFKGKGNPRRATWIKRGTEAIKAINSILRAPTHDLALFGLEIVKCLYMYEHILGIPRYSLDKALVSLCSKVFLEEIYNEIERRIQLHLEKMLNKEIHSIDECMSYLSSHRSSLDEIIVGYLMIRYRVYKEYKKETYCIVERVDSKLKVKARKAFGFLVDGCRTCFLESKVKELLAQRIHTEFIIAKREEISHDLTKDEIEYIRENYPLVSCFYNIPEDIGVPYLRLRKSFDVRYFVDVFCWNGFVESIETFYGAHEEKLLDTAFLRGLCFQMCIDRKYNLNLMEKFIDRSTSFEKAFMEGYRKVVFQEYKTAKERFRMVLEIIRDLRLGIVPEIQLWVYDLLSMCHMFCGEYFESVFYLNKGIELSHRYQLGFVSLHFLNCKFIVERIGGIQGPFPKIRLDLEETINSRFVIESEQKAINNRILTNLLLKDDMSNLREMRTLEIFAMFKPSTLYKDIERTLSRLKKFTVVSLYSIDGCLFINDFRGFVKVDRGFGDTKVKMNEILAKSRNVLKGNVTSDLDKARWWMERMELDTQLGEILRSVGDKFDRLSIGKDVILVLDETTTEFPFESIPAFKGKSVYRVPSLEYLEDVPGLEIDRKSFFYLLDPENNLFKTRERISGFLRSSGIKNGITGRPPSDLECKEADGYDVLLYFGHGSGLKYLKVSGEGKIMFLFGCNSAKLLCVENYKRNGSILKHLRRNSMIVGCLWEVTDKDIDNFSVKVIESLINGSTNIGEVVSRFRDEFKLRYLNGASVVIYGFR
ncbi:separase [Encephalitozoon intestinalis ATCC 50506]|uniref:separase n=1 Tax=Encephalitozoon intestinalis (strain ATCC 50506) TaxID=876142 RepID=E0S7V8_ENCIT|nr:separase [Encephalitozoon intestinalis ATCC 50506]ADM11793.1 separase [Encephalitozoon intestinalis ATCC 50506]UTX45541.1 separase [Encephalitozoon intestinalis]